MSIAMLIIDVQKQYVSEPGFSEVFPVAQEYINEVSKYFRNAGLPVVHVQHVESDEVVNTEGFQISEKIVQKEGDLYVRKTYGNSFWKTDLEETLKKLDVDYVLCTGLAAQHCVLATYNGAIERGFKASMLQHGIVGRSFEEVKNVQYDRHTIDYQSVRYIINLMKKQ